MATPFSPPKSPLIFCLRSWFSFSLSCYCWIVTKVSVLAPAPCLLSSSEWLPWHATLQALLPQQIKTGCLAHRESSSSEKQREDGFTTLAVCWTGESCSWIIATGPLRKCWLCWSLLSPGLVSGSGLIGRTLFSPDSSIIYGKINPFECSLALCDLWGTRWCVSSWAVSVLYSR